jgi:hypothetical protein
LTPADGQSVTKVTKVYGFTLLLAPGCARIVESEVAAGTNGRITNASSRSFTTEYPANGSFFRPQNPSALAKASAVAVCKELSRAADSVGCQPSREPSPEGSWDGRMIHALKAVGVSSEFIMVKLLRAYGECLGARSR